MTLISFWTVDRIEELTRHWNSGMTGGQIAKSMSVTRNAIIGKAHRLGLTRRTVELTDADRARRERRCQEANARRVVRQRNSRNQFRGDKPMRELPAAPEPFAGSLNLPFVDMRPYSSSTPNECRFIAEGGPDYLVCGNETLPGEGWCAHCKGIVFYKAQTITDVDRIRRQTQMRKLTWTPPANRTAEAAI